MKHNPTNSSSPTLANPTPHDAAPKYHENEPKPLPQASTLAPRRTGWLGKLFATLLALFTLAVVASCTANAYRLAHTHSVAELQHSLTHPPKQPAKLRGIYTQTLELAEFDDGQSRYHVYDPKQLLSAYAKTQGQTGVTIRLEVCLQGHVSEAGSYGHLGRDKFELWVENLCQ